MSDIRIHKPVPGLHSWGIEFNYSPEDRISTDADANDFVHAVNTIRQKMPFLLWFHQCGATIENHVQGFRGYQFFEYWGPNGELNARQMANAVAEMIGCKVVED